METWVCAVASDTQSSVPPGILDHAGFVYCQAECFPGPLYASSATISLVQQVGIQHTQPSVAQRFDISLLRNLTM